MVQFAHIWLCSCVGPKIQNNFGTIFHKSHFCFRLRMRMRPHIHLIDMSHEVDVFENEECRNLFIREQQTMSEILYVSLTGNRTASEAHTGTWMRPLQHWEWWIIFNYIWNGADRRAFLNTVSVQRYSVWIIRITQVEVGWKVTYEFPFPNWKFHPVRWIHFVHIAQTETKREHTKFILSKLKQSHG